MVDAILDTGATAERVRERMENPNESLHAPHVVDLEVLHALRRNIFHGLLSLERADEAIEDFADIRLVRYPHAPFVGRIWALRENVTAYDAAYVTLAEALDAPLLTTDGRLARSSGHNARMEFFG